MTILVLPAELSASVGASTDETSQRALVLAALGSGNVTMRYFAGATLVETVTHGPVVPDSLDPLGFALGPRLAYTVNVADQTVTHAVLRGSTNVDVLRYEASDLTPNPMVTRAGQALNAADPVLPKLRTTARAALPATPAPPPPPPPPPPPAPTPPTIATLALPDSATVGIPLAGTITLDRAATVNVTVNLTITGGTLSTAAPLVLAGQTNVGFTATGAAAGTPMVVTLASTNPALTVAGSPQTATVTAAATPVAAGTWEILTVAPHQRRVFGSKGGEGNAPYSPAVAIAAEAKPLQTVTSIPNRYATTIEGRPGEYYLVGGLHSNYPGNEIERIKFPRPGSNVVVTEINHPGNIPPEGPQSGYAAGTSGSIHRMYGVATFMGSISGDTLTITSITGTLAANAPVASATVQPAMVIAQQLSGTPGKAGVYRLTESRAQPVSSQPFVGLGDLTDPACRMDPTDWQPHPGHQWSKLGWHAIYGFFVFAAYARPTSYSYGRPVGPLLTDANGMPIPSADEPEAGFGRRNQGAIRWNEETRKYELIFTNVPDARRLPAERYAFVGESGFSNWSSYWNCNIALYNKFNQGGCFFHKFTIEGDISFLLQTNAIGGFDGTSGDGYGITHTEQGHFLIGPADAGPFANRFSVCLWGYNFQGSKFLILPLPPEVIADVVPGMPMCFTFAVARNSRRIFWIISPGENQIIRFYVSTFEDIMNWSRITFNNELRNESLSWFTVDHKALHVNGGYLELVARARIEGQAPPAITTGENYTDGASRFMRVKVDVNSEDLPPIDFRRYDYRLQDFRFSQASNLQLIGSKHVNWAYDAVRGRYYMVAGDAGQSFVQSTANLVFDATSRGYTFSQMLSEVEPMPQTGPEAAAGFRHRPVSCDDGALLYCGATNSNPLLAGRFIYVRGGEGLSWNSNEFNRPAYAALAENPTSWNAGGPASQSPSAVAAMQADGWTLDKFLIYDPGYNGGKGAFRETRTDLWPVETYGEPLGHPTLQSQSAARNGIMDLQTNVVWRFVDYNNTLTLCGYKFNDQTVELLKVNVWEEPGNSDQWSNLWYIGEQQPTSDAAVVDLPANGAHQAWPKFGWNDTAAGRLRTAAGHNWSHKELWLDQRDGKLYIVSPSTGYLWCYETRAPRVNSRGGGKTIPFYPVGNRIPLIGTYPATDAREHYPPKKWFEAGYALGSTDTRMNSFLAPFKGGLLWWSSCHHEGGTFGRPIYAFWRRLGYTGDWTECTMPQEFEANSLAPVSQAHDNAEIMAISTAGTYDDNINATCGPRPFFWRIT